MLPDVDSEFPGAKGYLNTASMGLPPRMGAEHLRSSIDLWQSGEASATGYDQFIDEARLLFANMVNMPVDSVAIGSQVSALVGMVASGLPPKANVLCPEGDFTSVLFPFLARSDLNVTLVPLEALEGSIRPGIDLVAFSLVQSADGRVTNGNAVARAAESVGAKTLVDTTQAAGWLPFDARDYDITVTGTYKWLLSPRGTAFMTVRENSMQLPVPLYAGWYAGEAPWDSIYGAPLRLAESARRFDLSPGWLAWVGTASALRYINALGIESIHAHNIALTNACRNKLGLPESDSAILSLELPSSASGDQLNALSTSVRAGRLRVGFHLYNNAADVASLVQALGVSL